MQTQQACILAERRGAVSVATFNRPEKLNAINTQLATELILALDAFEADDGIRAIVLTGAGERAFSAGGDMTEVGERVGPCRRSQPILARRGSSADSVESLENLPVSSPSPSGRRFTLAR